MGKQTEITKEWMDNYLNTHPNMTEGEALSDFMLREGQKEHTPFYVTANNPYLSLMGYGNEDLSAVADNGRYFLDDLWDFRNTDKYSVQADANQKAREISEGGGGESGGGEGSSSSRSWLEDMMANYPAFAQMMTNVALRERPRQLEGELGMQRQYLPQFLDVMQNLYSVGRTGEIEDVRRLAPAVTEAYRAGEDPRTREMRDLLGEQIFSNLQAGTSLTPLQERNAVQAQRSAELSRGIGGGQGGANREAITRFLTGERLGAQRRAEAGGFVAHEDARQQNPFDIVLGMASAQPTRTIANYDQGLRAPLSDPNALNYGSLVAQVESASANRALQQQGLDLQREQWQAGFDLMKQYFPQMYGYGG